MYRYLKTALVSLLALGTIAAPMSAQAQDQEEINVGVLQFVEHESLDQNYQGFIDGLEEAGYVEGENLTLNYLNASGDTANLQSMSENVTNSSDYIFAIATPAAQAIANVEQKKPVLFSSVSDPVGAGLVENLEEPEANITGTTDAGPIEDQVALLQAVVPDAERVGIIYNSGEANSMSEAEKATAALEAAGIEVVEATVTSTNDISQVMSGLVNDDVDAIFTVTDNTIASAMTLVGDLALEAELPIIGGSKDMALANGLTTYGLDYYELGKQTAGMLVEIIESGEIIPVESADTLELVVNEENAETLGLDLSNIDLGSEETSDEENTEESEEESSEDSE
ncbi:MAG TPA: ABC transporter substrate-binding protein [Facklamia tabacinasalis]|uniref:ABC transporter substrate-binding protein n=1 Tax=Ruoffia tabacinasalis TaxID=87458 RepID=A0A5R9DVN0_9LACT|nr:ABC transporter substrate-binding protein [Ruoffia tabacinasalis]TLQ41686.1 ABC transporter substrate-binding protein [Ruoffia tabacinasalis]HJG47624.1 ABC transporter substrate-binding protein [Ruoffia tabacinasalis]